MSSRHSKLPHMVYSPTELASRPYAVQFKSDMLPLVSHVNDALLLGAQSCELFRDVKQEHPLHLFEQRHA